VYLKKISGGYAPGPPGQGRGDEGEGTDGKGDKGKEEREEGKGEEGDTGTEGRDWAPPMFDTDRRPAYNRWDRVDKIAHLNCALTGAASQLLWDAPEAENLTYDRLVSKLIDQFGSADQRELYVAQLRTRRRRQNESLPELYSGIKRLMLYKNRKYYLK
jgi:hypothetical protein